MIEFPSVCHVLLKLQFSLSHPCQIALLQFLSQRANNKYSILKAELYMHAIKKSHIKLQLTFHTGYKTHMTCQCVSVQYRHPHSSRPVASWVYQCIPFMSISTILSIPAPISHKLSSCNSPFSISVWFSNGHICLFTVYTSSLCPISSGFCFSFL